MLGSGKPQINREALAEVTGGDLEFEIELVQTFVESAKPLLDDLGSALKSGDEAKATHASHTLKGSSRSIGAEQFGAISEVIEHASKHGELHTLTSEYEDLVACFEALIAESGWALDSAA